jgi:hypothetical protein
MYCKNCGTQNDDSALVCTKCGQPLPMGSGPQGPLPMIPNYLVQSILVTLFCCLPLGVVAIVYAAQVNGMVQSGNIQGAINSSNNAKMWCWVSFGIGIAWVVIYLIFMMFFAAAGIQAQR